MILRTALVLLALTLCCASYTYGQIPYDLVSVQIDVSGEIAPNTIRAGVPFNVDIYLSNDSLGSQNWVQFPFRLTGSGGVTQVIYLNPDSGDIRLGAVALLNGFGTGGYWNLINEVYGLNKDGILPDTMIHGGLGSKAGWPPDSGYVQHYSLRLQIDQTGTFCLEWFYPESDFDPPPEVVKFDPVCLTVIDSLICGDANGDGNVSILDITYMINALYRQGPNPTPPEAADVNHSGSFNVLDIVYMINSIYKGGPLPYCSGIIDGSLIGHGPCKSNPIAKVADTVLSNQDCARYQYNGSGTLMIKHLNAGFNCCPVITADVHIVGNTITIEEKDSTINGGCSCLCIFDVDYQINNLPPGNYNIRFIEPLKAPADPPLDFNVNLTGGASGQECVSRCCYPWGQ